MSSHRPRLFSRVVCAVVCAVVALGGTVGLVHTEAQGGEPLNNPLQIVTTTNIVADLTREVAGGLAVVESLLPAGADPHVYQPVPSDLRAVAESDLVLLHGFGLDAQLDEVIRQGGAAVPRFVVTAGLTPSSGAEVRHERESRHEREHGEDGHEHGEGDPHFWFDPTLVKEYVRNIRDALNAVDSAHSDVYEANAARYLKELGQLHVWIREQVDRIPPERRLLVTSHDAFRYFAERYGFEVIGTIIPSFSTEAEPSAHQLAELVEVLRATGVPAIFTETTVSQALAETVAQEVGRHVRVYRLFSDSLSESSGPADTYMKMMRYNVRTILEGLRER